MTYGETTQITVGRVRQLKKWFECFVLLPIRWYSLHIRNWRELRQRCKVCGCRDKFDYHVPDALWEAVVPQRYQGRVVCLACFDDFAARKGIPYAPSLSEIHFAGDQESFVLDTVDLTTHAGR